MFHFNLFFASFSLLGLAVLVMAWCAYGIWKNIKLRQEIDKQREALVGHHKTAEYLLQRAKHIATMAEVSKPFAVCESCNQIRERYIRDENGVTCIECAEKHTERE